MTFEKRHTPNQTSDLVFKDPAVHNVITDYAGGLRDRHLLLHGPAGSGKSIAAKMILNTRVGDLAGSSVAQAINPSDYTYQDFNRLLNDWSVQKQHGVPRGYTVIDEIDHFSEKMLKKLRSFIDSTELGTIIATTNNLHKLDDPLKDRFLKQFVERPSATDWTTRAQTILAKEGVNFTAQQVGVLLNSFNGSARSLIDWLEEYSLKYKKNPVPVLPAQPAAGPSTVPLQSKILINGKKVQTK